MRMWWYKAIGRECSTSMALDRTGLSSYVKGGIGALSRREKIAMVGMGRGKGGAGGSKFRMRVLASRWRMGRQWGLRRGSR
jgi:hypothetical protein